MQYANPKAERLRRSLDSPDGIELPGCYDVLSALILESAGLAGDRHVLQTVRTWRYRPATCNGVPTEIEGKVEFSSR